MIPKIIHYCWLSGEKYPESVLRCINSWKRILPDYEFRLWDGNRFDIASSVWVKEAVACGKYAFASDYIRLYALYHFGGIYLDSDVEVIKRFDDLLALPYFICKENSRQEIEAAVIGAEKGCEWIGVCLKYYTGKHFEKRANNHSAAVLPYVMTQALRPYYRFRNVDSIYDFGTDNSVVYRFPADYFSPKSYVTGRILLTGNTYCIHHFAGTWQPRWKKFLLKLWVPLSVKYPAVTDRIKSFLE